MRQVTSQAKRSKSLVLRKNYESSRGFQARINKTLQIEEKHAERLHFQRNPKSAATSCERYQILCFDKCAQLPGTLHTTST